MLTEICGYLHNYFTEDKDKHFGKFTISGGSIQPLDFLADGQYFRIVGSKFNDGIYQHPVFELTDETFEGAVWAISYLPPELVALAEEIKSEEEHKKAAIADGGWDMFQSQSFGGYSGTVKQDTSWQAKYRKQLNKWRKL